MSANAGGDGASTPLADGDGGRNPIKVDPGKGWWIKLPMPSEVLRKLGGAAQLGERLRPIADTTLDHYAALTPHATDTLTAAYDELFHHLKALPAGSGDSRGTGDPDNPITVNPGKGWSVVLPVPQEVLGKLGGSAEVRERLRPVLDADPEPDSELTADASEKLASVYGEVLQSLETVTRPEEHR